MTPAQPGELMAHRVAKGRMRHAARFADNFEEEKKEEPVGKEPGTDCTTRNSGTNLAGSLKTDPVWNLSLRENAKDIAPNSNQS